MEYTNELFLQAPSGITTPIKKLQRNVRLLKRLLSTFACFLLCIALFLLAGNVNKFPT